MHERLICQSVSKNTSLHLEEKLEHEVWDSLEADKWAVLGSEWEQYCYGIQRNRDGREAIIVNIIDEASRFHVALVLKVSRLSLAI